jgi:hypothetical protein
MPAAKGAFKKVSFNKEGASNTGEAGLAEAKPEISSILKANEF